MDYYGVFYYGTSNTHIDALCHVWDENGMWDGRDHNDVIGFTRANYGTVDQWSDGILTRGVLLDVPKHRGRPYVTADEPVHGWELEDIAKARGVAIESGDAVFVYSRALLIPEDFCLARSAHAYASSLSLMNRFVLRPPLAPPLVRNWCKSFWILE